MPGMIPIGETIAGRYKVLDIIASAGQADVAKAHDQKTSETVALKRLNVPASGSGRQEAIERFRREAGIRLDHPNAVTALDSFEYDGDFYIVFRWNPGHPLDQHLHQQGGRLTADEAVGITRITAEVLAEAHALGFVHRDLKPANLLVSQGKPFVIDFGIAKQLTEATITTAGALLGTLVYMAPEQLIPGMAVDHRADIYALGNVAYLMLTGQPPVQSGSPAKVAISICQETPPAPCEIVTSIPLHVSDACMRCLAKAPEQRFQSAKEVIRALDGAPDGGTTLHERCLACGHDLAGEPSCPACGRSFSPADHRLTIQSLGIDLRVPEGSYIVGRDQIAPHDAHVSRQHLAVTCLNGTLEVQDNGSTNGLKIDGCRTQHRTEIHAGQTLSIARNIAVYYRK